MAQRHPLIALTVAAALTAPAVSAAFADEASDHAALSRVLSAVQAEASEDHVGAERLVLTQSREADADSADLHVFAGPGAAEPGAWIASFEGIAYAGMMSGQQPVLEVAENGSIRLRSEQSAIGRAPWQQTLTLALRDKRLVVAGFTYAMLDRVSGGSLSCDWNLLTGAWEVERSGPADDGTARPDLKRSGRQPEDMALAQWARDPEQFPKFCRDAE